MTIFKDQERLNRLNERSFIRDKVEIFEIIYNYIDENTDELAEIFTDKLLKDIVDVKDFNP